MNIEEVYQKIIAELKTGNRGLIKFSSGELNLLLEKLNSPEVLQNEVELEKILCLIEHSASFYERFDAGIINLLKTDTNNQIKIFALNCARKHIIEARFQKGLRLEFDFLETLKSLLHSPNPEIVEWTLRVIEGTGNQGVYFLREFDKIKPPPWKWFNPHQRAVREIIALLERRWSPFERIKP